LENVNLSYADLRNVELIGRHTRMSIWVKLTSGGIKYDNLILPMIASSKLDNAKMSYDMQKDIEKLRSGQS